MKHNELDRDLFSLPEARTLIREYGRLSVDGLNFALEQNDNSQKAALALWLLRESGNERDARILTGLEYLGQIVVQSS